MNQKLKLIYQSLRKKNWLENVCIRFCIWKARRLSQSRSKVEIPGWARQEERLIIPNSNSRSSLIQTPYYSMMYLIQGIKFSLWKPRRLNLARTLRTGELKKKKVRYPWRYTATRRNLETFPLFITVTIKKDIVFLSVPAPPSVRNLWLLSDVTLSAKRRNHHDQNRPFPRCRRPLF